MFPGGGVDGAGGLKAASGAKNAAQMLQMQRFLAAGGVTQRSAGGRVGGNYFSDGANFGDMEFARQLQQQRQATAAAAQRHAAPWTARDDFTGVSGAGFGGGYDFAGGMVPPQSAGSRGYVFKCPDCSFNKSSCEDLEIHIKTEHLNWLPFQCPFCQQSRASDSQMREHIHSVHKKPENKYFYVDNPMAKRMLQDMIDRALFSASRNASVRNGGYGGAPFPAGNASNGGPPFLNPFNSNSNGNYFPDDGNSPRAYGSDGDGASPTRKQPRLTPQVPVAQPARRSSPATSSDRHSNHSGSQHSDDFGGGSGGVTVLAKKTSNGEDLLAQLQQQLACQRGDDDENAENDSAAPADGDGGNASDDGTGGDEPLVLDDETSAQLSQIFGAAALANATDGGGDFGASASDSASHNDVLQNLSAIFSAAAANGAISAADALKLAESAGADNGDNVGLSPIRFNHNNNPIRRRAPRGCGSNQSISKKRVLGECAACHKPITAGARQMHMFYHLGKDQGTYRFRCKHENCDVEHYRKDQMENHHSKVHGKIEADMMEDRSLELYDQCQKMSMDLLGTVGNTPGPTAAKAQILYDNMQREAEMAAFRKRKRNRHSSSVAIGGAPRINFPAPTNNNLNHNNNGSNNNFGYRTNEENNNKSNNNNSTVDIDFIRRIQQQLKNRTTGNNSNSNGYGNRSFGGSQTTHNSNNSNAAVRTSFTSAGVDGSRHEECIKCLKCHQTIVGRTRGFHLLHHLHSDLNIVRYACQHCDFRHERAQSVQTHGKKEHGDEHCVLDLIDNYQDEVRAMSKECFGREKLFAKDERRRSRIAASESSQLTPSTTTTVEETKPIAPRIIIKTSPAVPSTPTVAAIVSQPASSSSAAAARRKASQRRFGIRRPKSRKQREEMAKLREVSMRLGGAQYFKKRSSESIACEICGKYNTTRLSQHAYNHLEDCSLYLCPQCNMGHCSRDIIVKHLKDFHDSVESPTDNRLRYAAEIKEMVRRCFPSCFIDAPIPTAADIERLKINLNLSDKALATFDADAEAPEAGEDGHHDEEEEEMEEDDEERQDVQHDDVKLDGNEIGNTNDESLNDEGTASGEEEEDSQLHIADEEEEEEEEQAQTGAGLVDEEEDEEELQEEDAEAEGELEDEPNDSDDEEERQEDDDDNGSLEISAAGASLRNVSPADVRRDGGAVGLETEDDY